MYVVCTTYEHMYVLHVNIFMYYIWTYVSSAQVQQVQREQESGFYQQYMYQQSSNIFNPVGTAYSGTTYRAPTTHDQSLERPSFKHQDKGAVTVDSLKKRLLDRYVVLLFYSRILTEGLMQVVKKEVVMVTKLGPH